MRMLPPSLCCLLALLFLSQCKSPDLERPGVPLLWGMRLEDPIDAEVFAQNLKAPGEAGSWMIELTVLADSQGLPMVPELQLGQLGQQLAKEGIAYHLALTTTDLADLFPEDIEIFPEAWFQALDSTVRHTLSAFPNAPLSLIVGNDWLPVEGAEEEWTQLWTGLRQDYPFPLAYGFQGDRPEAPSWIEATDWLALEYPPVADPNPKPFALEQNPKMGELALRLDRPVFIYRANLIGEDKTINLKNRLRFWPEEMILQGMVANSIYPKMAFTDRSSYFAAAEDEEFITYWKEYSSQQ